MRHFVIVFAVVLAAVGAGSAGAGGWATVGFEPLPDGTAAGTSWKPTIFVKQHGVTPLEGLHPLVTIHETSSGESRSFTAQPTAEPGVYEAEVVFPTPGDWRVAIDSGFGDSGVTYGPVTIGPAGAESDSPPVPLAAVAGALGALVACAALFLGLRRRWRLTPAS